MSAPPGACACDRALYTCSDFSNWSAAQACFNQCRLTAGYDIHGLDEDGDGVACEMAMEGPSPFAPTAQPAPGAPITEGGAAPGGMGAPPLIQNTTTATMPVVPPIPAPTGTTAITGVPGIDMPGTGMTGTGVTGAGLPGTGAPGAGLPETGITGAGAAGEGLPGTGITGTGAAGAGLPGAVIPGLGLTATQGISVVEGVTELPAYLENVTPGAAATPIQPGASAPLLLRFISIFIVVAAAILVWLRRRG